MGLRDAIVEIAEQMEKDSDCIPEDQSGTMAMWIGTIRQLRSALKASEGEDERRLIQAGVGAEKELIKKERSDEWNVKREQALIEKGKYEESETNFKLCTGGKSDGVMIPTYPDTPVTARTWIEGEVYEFDGNEWKFNESVTEKMLKEIHNK